MWTVVGARSSRSCAEGGDICRTMGCGASRSTVVGEAIVSCGAHDHRDTDDSKAAHGVDAKGSARLGHTAVVDMRVTAAVELISAHDNRISINSALSTADTISSEDRRLCSASLNATKLSEGARVHATFSSEGGQCVQPVCKEAIWEFFGCTPPSSHKHVSTACKGRTSGAPWADYPAKCPAALSSHGVADWLIYTDAAAAQPANADFSSAQKYSKASCSYDVPHAHGSFANAGTPSAAASATDACPRSSPTAGHVRPDMSTFCAWKCAANEGIPQCLSRRLSQGLRHTRVRLEACGSGVSDFQINTTHLKAAVDQDVRLAAVHVFLMNHSYANTQTHAHTHAGRAEGGLRERLSSSSLSHYTPEASSPLEHGWGGREGDTRPAASHGCQEGLCIDVDSGSSGKRAALSPGPGPAPQMLNSPCGKGGGEGKGRFSLKELSTERWGLVFRVGVSSHRDTHGEETLFFCDCFHVFELEFRKRATDGCLFIA